MANSIALATKYIPFIDQLYRESSLTAVLENTKWVRDFDGANAVKILSVATTGLGDYDRNTGFTDGSITATWETHTLSIDRGTRLLLDQMDNNETLGETLGESMRSLIADEVVPEVDAYRFEQIWSKADNQIVGGTLTASTVKAAIDAGIEAMDEDEVPQEGRIMFVSNAVYNFLKNADAFSYDIDASKASARDGRIPMYDGMQIVKVPLSRFNTAITLGTDGFSQTGDAINFMIVAKSAVFPVVKHNPSNIISPEANQTADAYLMKYRIYHDMFVPANKTVGIYANRTGV